MEYLFNGEKVTLMASTYASYNNLYVGLISEGEPYADITVNLKPLTDPYTAFVDTNNLPNIGKFLTDNHIAEYLGTIQTSGYCAYPLYRFNPEIINKLMGWENNFNPAYNDIYVFIPATKHIIKIAEGTGKNLNNEDYAEGYVDYIDYTAYQMEDEFPEYDGGMIMLKEEFRIKYKSTEECIPDVLEDVYNDREQPFIVLK